MTEAEIADQVRQLLAARNDVEEKRIVGGGLGFMVGGHLCCGVSSRGLTVRVGADAKGDMLALPHVRALTLGKREAAAFVVVEPDGLGEPAAVASWVERGLRIVETLS